MKLSLKTSAFLFCLTGTSALFAMVKEQPPTSTPAAQSSTPVAATNSTLVAAQSSAPQADVTEVIIDVNFQSPLFADPAVYQADLSYIYGFSSGEIILSAFQNYLADETSEKVDAVNVIFAGLISKRTAFKTTEQRRLCDKGWCDSFGRQSLDELLKTASNHKKREKICAVFTRLTTLLATASHARNDIEFEIYMGKHMPTDLFAEAAAQSSAANSGWGWGCVVS